MERPQKVLIRRQTATKMQICHGSAVRGACDTTGGSEEIPEIKFGR